MDIEGAYKDALDIMTSDRNDWKRLCLIVAKSNPEALAMAAKKTASYMDEINADIMSTALFAATAAIRDGDL